MAWLPPSLMESVAPLLQPVESAADRVDDLLLRLPRRLVARLAELVLVVAVAVVLFAVLVLLLHPCIHRLVEMGAHLLDRVEGLLREGARGLAILVRDPPQPCDEARHALRQRRQRRESRDQRLDILRQSERLRPLIRHCLPEPHDYLLRLVPQIASGHSLSLHRSYSASD